MLEMLTTGSFWVDVLKIIMIDVLLSGDNAVVIALACRNLPLEQRKKGIMLGVMGAIVLRIVLTFFAVGMLSLPYLKLIGAFLLIWIGVKYQGRYALVRRGKDHHHRGLRDELGQRVGRGRRRERQHDAASVRFAHQHSADRLEQPAGVEIDRPIPYGDIRWRRIAGLCGGRDVGQRGLVRTASGSSPLFASGCARRLRTPGVRVGSLAGCP
jgi:hypothetical protein